MKMTRTDANFALQQACLHGDTVYLGNASQTWIGVCAAAVYVSISYMVLQEPKGAHVWHTHISDGHLQSCRLAILIIWWEKDSCMHGMSSAEGRKMDKTKRGGTPRPALCSAICNRHFTTKKCRNLLWERLQRRYAICVHI